MGFLTQQCTLTAAHFKINYDNTIRKINQSKENDEILRFCPIEWLESLLRCMDDIIALKALEQYIDPFGHGYIPQHTSIKTSSHYIPKG